MYHTRKKEKLQSVSRIVTELKDCRFARECGERKGTSEWKQSFCVGAVPRSAELQVRLPDMPPFGILVKTVSGGVGNRDGNLPFIPRHSCRAWKICRRFWCSAASFGRRQIGFSRICCRCLIPEARLRHACCRSTAARQSVAEPPQGTLSVWQAFRSRRQLSACSAIC